MMYFLRCKHNNSLVVFNNCYTTRFENYRKKSLFHHYYTCKGVRFRFRWHMFNSDRKFRIQCISSKIVSYITTLTFANCSTVLFIMIYLIFTLVYGSRMSLKDKEYVSRYASCSKWWRNFSNHQLISECTNINSTWEIAILTTSTLLLGI